MINTEESNKPIITEIPYTGYSLELFLGDFNGDGRDEIMVRGEYGGSGSYAIAAIYKYKDGYLEEIFNPDMFSEKYKFIGTQQPIISAINGAYPIKSVFQKNYFLFIRQRVIGVSNADKIGYIGSFIDLLNNDIKVIEMGSYHFGEKES